MIYINLLPHREIAKQKRKELFNRNAVAAGFLGVVLAAATYLFFQAGISNQETRNAYLKAENVRLDTQIKEIANIQKEIELLRARQEAVESLQADRNQPVNLLAELAQWTPEGVIITSMKQDGQKLSLSGIAQSNDRVSEFLRNLGGKSAWLHSPELVEIVFGSFVVSAREQRRVANFSMRVSMHKSLEKDKPIDKDAKPKTTP